jgi:hypothetical protein
MVLWIIVSTKDEDVGFVIPDYAKALYIGIVNCVTAFLIVMFLNAFN